MEYIILALAVWRIAALVTQEQGPHSVFERLRVACGVRYKDGDLIAETELAKLIACPWCLSIHLGCIATVLYLLFGNPAVWMALPFALSALAIIADKYVNN